MNHIVLDEIQPAKVIDGGYRVKFRLDVRDRLPPATVFATQIGRISQDVLFWNRMGGNHRWADRAR